MGYLKFKKDPNHLKIGLKSDKKLKKSVYSFLYERYIDWAIILVMFIAPLPYLSSKYYIIIVIKFFIYSILVYFVIRYVLVWKELQDYYRIYRKAIDQSKSLIDKKKIKESEAKGFRDFQNDLMNEIKNLVNDFKQDNEYLSLKEFMLKYPKKFAPLETILNKDIKLTSTTIGLSLGTLSVLSHLRGIPKIELKNYRRLITIVLLTVFFFIIYFIENSFL